MSTHLILTVGTGTSGKHSNLAQGLLNTLKQLAPDKYWLVPSVSPDSIAVADLIRENHGSPGSFESWNEHDHYCQILQPDDLECCRTTLREVIGHVRLNNSKGRLLINPTSGTKQMSVGATLAALEMSDGEIVFTVGQRSEGVVITGTEKIVTFDSRAFLRERDQEKAKTLFDSGAYWGAAKIIHTHTLIELYHFYLAMHYWQRLDYTKARLEMAAVTSSNLKNVRAHLETLSSGNELRLEVLVDLLISAERLAQWGENESALGRVYRTLELGAKYRLASEHNIMPPYKSDDLCQLMPRLTDYFKNLEGDNGECFLGLNQSMELLGKMDDVLADGYRSDQKLRLLVQRRNQTVIGHGTKSINRDEIENALQGSVALFSHAITGFKEAYHYASSVRPKNLGMTISKST